MTCWQGSDGSQDRREVLTPKPTIYKVEQDQKFPSATKHYTVQMLEQPLKGTKTTGQSCDESLCFGWHFLYLLWKMWLHLFDLWCDCLKVWWVWSSPAFLGRLHQWDFCKPTRRWSPCRPLWSLGTPSMTSMANRTTSKHIICMARHVEEKRPIGYRLAVADEYSFKSDKNIKSNSRDHLNIFKTSNKLANTAALPNTSPSCCYPWDLPNTQTPAVLDGLLNPVTMFLHGVRWDLNEGNSIYNMHGEVHSPLHLTKYTLNGRTVSHLPSLFRTDNSPFNIQKEFVDAPSFLMMFLCMQQDGGSCRRHAVSLFSVVGLLTKPQPPQHRGEGLTHRRGKAKEPTFPYP